MPAAGAALRAHQHVDLTALDSRAASDAPRTSSSQNSTQYEPRESASKGDRDLCTDSVNNPLKLRKSAKRERGIQDLQQKCCYQHCPSPLRSTWNRRKQTWTWRVITPNTSAGGHDWGPLVGQTLCNACYSTYCHSGTLVRALPTNASGVQQTKKTLPPSKRNHVASASSEIACKRQDCKNAVLPGVDLDKDQGSQVLLAVLSQGQESAFLLLPCSAVFCLCDSGLQVACLKLALYQQHGCAERGKMIAALALDLTISPLCIRVLLPSTLVLAKRQRCIKYVD